MADGPAVVINRATDSGEGSATCPRTCVGGRTRCITVGGPLSAGARAALTQATESSVEAMQIAG